MHAAKRIIHRMKIGGPFGLFGLFPVMGVSALLAGVARAGDGIEPEVLEPEFAWLALLYAVVSAVAIGVVAFKDAKRTHLD